MVGLRVPCRLTRIAVRLTASAKATAVKKADTTDIDPLRLRACVIAVRHVALALVAERLIALDAKVETIRDSG